MPHLIPQPLVIPRVERVKSQAREGVEWPAAFQETAARPEERRPECELCCTNVRSACILDCRHVVSCVDCLRRHVSANGARCTVCKTRITRVLRVFC